MENEKNKHLFNFGNPRRDFIKKSWELFIYTWVSFNVMAYIIAGRVIEFEIKINWAFLI